MLKTLKRWWNKPGDDLNAAMPMAFEAGAKAARKECAEICREEGRRWKAEGATDGRDFEICALLIERSNGEGQARGYRVACTLWLGELLTLSD